MKNYALLMESSNKTISIWKKNIKIDKKNPERNYQKTKSGKIFIII